MALQPLSPHPERTAIVEASRLTTKSWSDWFLQVRAWVLELVAGRFVGPIMTPGVTFPDPPVPSADPHTLDDYEEGTWTPTIGGTGGQSGQTYAQQDGYFVKVGRLVHAACRVQLSALGTITGAVQIKGLPFPALNSSGYRATGTVVWTTTTTAYTSIGAVINANATVIDLVATAAATTSLSTQALAQGNLAAATRLVVSVVYEADA